MSTAAPQHFEKRRFFLIAFSLLAIVATLLMIDYWRMQPNQGFDQIPVAAPTPPLSPCANTTASALQRCCGEWAQSHNLLTAQCVGEWYLDAGSCAYQCLSVESTTTPTTTPSSPLARPNRRGV